MQNLGYFLLLFFRRMKKSVIICHSFDLKREVGTFFREMWFNKLIAVKCDFYSQYPWN